MLHKHDLICQGLPTTLRKRTHEGSHFTASWMSESAAQDNGAQDVRWSDSHHNGWDRPREIRGADSPGETIHSDDSQTSTGEDRRRSEQLDPRRVRSLIRALTRRPQWLRNRSVHKTAAIWKNTYRDTFRGGACVSHAALLVPLQFSCVSKPERQSISHETKSTKAPRRRSRQRGDSSRVADILLGPIGRGQRQVRHAGCRAS